MRKFSIPLIFLLSWPPIFAAADPERDWGRSMVLTGLGIVASTQTLASSAGADILRRGGNAVDAAIAANAALGVTEPMMNGLGGDLFAILYDAKTMRLYGINSSGWAATGVTPELLASKGITGSIPRKSIFSVTVPGAAAGWDALHKRFGKLPMEKILAPAIYYARNGIPVTEMVAQDWANGEKEIGEQPGFRQAFLPNGHAPKNGDIFRNPDLANSLHEVALHGRDGFYRGPTAERFVAFIKAQGGTMTAADLAEFQAEWVEPISTTYHGWQVSELPPNSQGIAALSMLNIMEQFPLASYGHNSAEALHVMIEAKKLAYADLAKYIGDPRFTSMPVPALLSKDLAKARSQLIDPDHAHCNVLPSELTTRLNQMGHDTTYLTVIDQEGNIVSLIQSNYETFGSGFSPPGTGFALQNRGGLFSLEPGHPNVVAPRKRPLHTLIPGFMQKGDVRIGFGILGGYNQAQAHAQFVSNIVDFGMNLQQALDAPRFTKLTFEGCDVTMERRISEAARSALTAKGHQITLVGAYSSTMGLGNAVMQDVHGTHYGASDPRADGAAIPQPPDWH